MAEVEIDGRKFKVLRNGGKSAVFESVDPEKFIQVDDLEKRAYRPDSILAGLYHESKKRVVIIAELIS